jgi:predicted RNase H-like nuclease (RuvC/YqgF family)
MADNNSILEFKVDTLTDNVRILSANVQQLGEYMQRLVLAEERISHVVDTNAKLQAELANVKSAVAELQIKEAKSGKTISIVDKFILAAATAAIIFMAAKTGLIS